MNDDYDGFFTYAAFGAALGLLSYYVFSWPVWAAILTAIVGPPILAFVMLIIILLIYKIAIGF